MRSPLELCSRLSLLVLAAFLIAADIPSAAASGGEESGELEAKLLAGQAHDALRKGNLYEAGLLAEKAVDLQPGQAAHHVLLSTILFRQNNHYYARQAAEKAIALDPANSGAQSLLGDIYYQEGILERALAQWEEVMRRGAASPHLRRKMEKAQREWKAEKEFEEEGSRNFTVRHDGTAPRSVIRSILWQLENIFRALEDEFGDSPPGDSIVILYARRNFHEITASPRWVGGTYDGKIRIPVGGLSTERQAEALGPVLAHELTHAFLRSIVARRLPLWFEEGLAEHFESGYVPPGHPWLLTGRSAPERYRSFQDLNAGLMGVRGPVEDAYATAAHAVKRLIDERGFETVRAVIEEMVTGKTFDQGLEEAAGMSLGEYEELWRSPVSAE